MSRVIKFRAWDPSEEKVMPVKCIDWANNLCTVDEGDNTITDNIDMFELMQFTGLKDDNGTEVYEGDIIQFGAQLGSKSEVEFIIKNSGFLVRDKFGDWQWLYDVLASTNSKVIGNVYENSELLNK